MEELKIKMYTFTVDCLDPHALAQFYATLLKWEIPFYDENFACVSASGVNQGEYPGITFQRNSQYIPPVWPEEPQAQQQMAHLDFAVNNLEEAVQYAIGCGATMAKQQFSKSWRVMLDPAGHPFCLCQMKQIFDNTHFALR